jgi:hypothetical protein
VIYEAICITDGEGNVELSPDLSDTLRQSIKVRWEDEGIGPYEYWGSKEVDKRMVMKADVDFTVRVRVVGYLADDELRFVVRDTWGHQPLVRVDDDTQVQVKIDYTVEWDDDTAVMTAEVVEVL